MAALAKASLTPLDGAEVANETGPAFEVQFNPTSLRLQMSNNNEGGKTRARQTEQHLGSGSTTLSIDLVFDSADEGSAESPVDVRTKTAEVLKFVLPKKGASDPPPRVRFHWGQLIFDGVMTSAGEEIDLFSSDGTALRSKVTVQISGQNPEFAAGQAGAGAKTGAGATQPGGGAGGAGLGGALGLELSAGVDLGLSIRTGVSLGGESAAGFAVRMGLDASAWRGVAAGLDSTLSLDAGLEIDFDASLSGGLGLGLTAGVEAGVSVSLEGSLGLGGSIAGGLGVPTASLGMKGTPPPAISVGAAPRGVASSQGLALAGSGGVNAAVETVKVARTEEAAASARAAFSFPGPAAATMGPPIVLAPAGQLASSVHVAGNGAASKRLPGLPAQPRAPLSRSSLPTPLSVERTAAAPPPPAADPAR